MMEVIFDLLSSTTRVPTVLSSKRFDEAGGTIGRLDDCHWVIADETSRLSRHHAIISYRAGNFFITDTSSNGTQSSDNGAYLRKNVPQRIEHGSGYFLGGVKVRARLVGDLATFDVDAGHVRAAGSTIPDDAFLDLDPLHTLDEQERMGAHTDELSALSTPALEPQQRADFARIETENLLVPELVPPPEAVAAVEPAPVERQSERFWEHFSAALGVDLEGLDQHGRESLAINAARLLKQSIGGLQQSLRTRSELKSELRLALTTVQSGHKSPLKSTQDASEALGLLLQGSQLGQQLAEQAIARAFHDLQAHQVALSTASRAALRSTLEHFSPQQLTLRFERDNKPLLPTSGSRWRAYNRYHQTLRQDDDWSERLLARDFAQAYEEQIRLIATLHTEYQG